MAWSILRRSPSAFYTWTNLDGSKGGQVSRNSKIDPSAIIEKFSVVLSGSVIGAEAHVRMGDIVDGETTIRFGPAIDPSRLRPSTLQQLG